MGDRTYRGLEIVQRSGSPPFYLTAVPAPELLEWCDVPRAQATYMAGYQRALNPKRTESLSKYIGLSPKNIIPGAIIVAVDEDYVSIESDGSGCKITVVEDTRNFETKLEELFGNFSTRLSNEELESADISFDAADWTEDADGEDDEPAPEHPSSYLASLAKELHTALTDWNALEGNRQAAIEEYIEGVSRPGLIIDGQHRVHGAAGVGGASVLLPVVLVPGLRDAEQVFQFYVLNSKAKPLRPTELRRIVSTTLTNDEIEDLYERFKQAGVNANEARWTHEMNTRPESPFRGRIDFGYEETGAIIKENVADQVVRAFMKMPTKRYGQLTRPLGETWKDAEARLQRFFWFWNAVKERYSSAWADAEVGADDGEQRNLFKKVALLTLQRFLLDRFVTALPYRDGAVPPLSSEAEIQKMVTSTLANLPGSFFEREWKLTQIDTSEGRKDLYKAMETVWNNTGTIHGNMKLFKG